MRIRRTPTPVAAFLAACATFAGSGCATGPGTPSPVGTPLQYGVPSVAAATYHAADTIVSTANTPAGAVTTTITTLMTVAMQFAEDPAGVRVTGSTESVSGTMSNPMMGTIPIPDAGLGGNLEAIVGRQGVTEIISAPEIPQMGGLQGVLQNSFTQPFFPPLPGGVAEPGTTWADTVEMSVPLGDPDLAGMEMDLASTTVTIYTVVGDTVVDGSTYLHIAIAGEAAVEGDMEVSGMQMTQKLSGTNTGLLLWDPRRGLVAYRHTVNEMAGTTSMGAMGTYNTSATTSSRVWLEN